METDKPDLDKRLCQQIFPGSIGSFADTGNQKQDKDPAAHDKNDRERHFHKFFKKFLHIFNRPVRRQSRHRKIAAAQKSKYIKALLPAFAET